MEAWWGVCVFSGCNGRPPNVTEEEEESSLTFQQLAVGGSIGQAQTEGRAAK